MKKTYRIFSTYLDNKAAYKEIPDFYVDENEPLYEVGQPYNLMDVIFGYKRVIDADLLITVESETDLINLFYNNSCNLILIKTDVLYKKHSIIYSFYKKRILQAIGVLLLYFPDYSFFFLKN